MIQLQFLNRLLQAHDSSLLLVNNFSDEYFSDYLSEYRFIKSHLDTYGSVPDPTTFLHSFPSFDWIEVKETNQYLVNELVRDRNKRKLASVFNTVKTLVEQDKTDEALATYLTMSNEMASAVSLQSVDIIQDTSRYDAYVERSKDYNKFYIKTGFTELDTIIGGWEREEELATIVARTNQGKSWILLKCAAASADQGLRVGIYSGEMSERKVGYRFDTLVSHISNSGLLRGRIEIQNEYKQHLDSLSTRFKGCVNVLTPAMINGPATVTALRAFIEKEKLDILFIDQHSLLEDDRKARNPVDRAANISRDLKNLQVLKKIPIIAVSQQNRESTENGVSAANVAQSDRISQDSTLLIFIENKDNVMTLNLVKSRDSINGKKLSYAIDLDKGIFTYVPEGNNAVNGSGCDDLRKEFEGEDSF